MRIDLEYRVKDVMNYAKECSVAPSEIETAISIFKYMSKYENPTMGYNAATQFLDRVER